MWWLIFASDDMFNICFCCWRKHFRISIEFSFQGWEYGEYVCSQVLLAEHTGCSPQKKWFQNFCWQDIDIELESTSRKCSIGHQMEFFQKKSKCFLYNVSKRWNFVYSIIAKKLKCFFFSMFKKERNVSLSNVLKKKKKCFFIQCLQKLGKFRLLVADDQSPANNFVAFETLHKICNNFSFLRYFFGRKIKFF